MTTLRALLLLLLALGAPTAAETLSLTFKTTAPGGGYAPKNIVAVWVESSGGAFVRTIGDWSGTRRSNLVQWRSAAGRSDTDAVMGATRINHNATLGVTWDLLPRGGGAPVADGTYTIRFENVDDNGGTPNHLTSLTFTKNGTPSSGTIPSQGGYLNITWNYSGRAAPAPAITSPATASGQIGMALSYQITASNSPTSFAASGLPGGLSVNTTTGLISGTPTTAGTSAVTLSASNANGTGQADLTLTIAPPPPAITSALSANGNAGSPFSYHITASHSPTGYGASGLPDGLAVDPASGLISGTPTAAGTSAVTIRASNPGGTGSAPLALTIRAALPVITSARTASGTVGSGFTYQITASGSPTAFAASGLPGGLAVNTSSGVISGTPTASGSTAVTISASNGGGTGSTTVTIAIAAIGGAPAITSALTATGVRGTPFAYQITASGSPTGYGATGLPGGLSVNPTSGLIRGTPTVVGGFSVTLSASNGSGTGTAVLTVTVVPPAPVITSATSVSGMVGAAFSYQITASDSPTAFAVSALAPGLALNPTSGAISGTPTTAGSSTMIVSATNPGGSGTASVLVAITPPLARPIITSATEATAMVGQPFTYVISASGSPTGYGASNLPGGLAIDPATGRIGGTPTEIGTTLVGLSATNPVGAGSATLAITVTPTATSAPGATPEEPGACGVGSVYACVIGWWLLWRRRGGARRGETVTG